MPSSDKQTKLHATENQRLSLRQTEPCQSKLNLPHLPRQFFSILCQNIRDKLHWIHAIFQNISLLTAVIFALLSVGIAKYLCIGYWFIALPCSQCTNPPITNTHTVWRVAGLRSQLTICHTTQPKCPIVSRNIWWLQIYCNSHTLSFRCCKCEYHWI